MPWKKFGNPGLMDEKKHDMSVVVFDAISGGFAGRLLETLEDQS